MPVFSPGLADSGYGVAAFQLAEAGGPRIVLDQLEHMRQLGELGKDARTTSVIYMGGGVPKDTIQLVTVMVDLARGGDVPYPHKYAVQITTDSPQLGGLSGCTFEEAISWGKIDADEAPARRLLLRRDDPAADPRARARTEGPAQLRPAAPTRLTPRLAGAKLCGP